MPGPCLARSIFLPTNRNSVSATVSDSIQFWIDKSIAELAKRETELQINS